MINQKEYMKKYYEEHKEYLKNYSLNFYRNHKEDYSKNAKKYREEHKEELKEYNKIYGKKRYSKNKAIILQQSKEYYLENKDKIKIKKKIYNKNHKKEIAIQCKKYNQKHKKQINEYLKNKLKTDINFRITHYLRVRLNKALKGILKSESTLHLLGCSIEFLKQHLEKQFKLGMTWQNYGKGGWEVDHIKQCIKFDLTKPKEQHKCFHYTNLQPLWLEENRGKNERLF
jgi:hypothetical protein